MKVVLDIDGKRVAILGPDGHPSEILDSDFRALLGRLEHSGIQERYPAEAPEGTDATGVLTTDFEGDVLAEQGYFYSIGYEVVDVEGE